VSGFPFPFSLSLLPPPSLPPERLILRLFILKEFGAFLPHVTL